MHLLRQLRYLKSLLLPSPLETFLYQHFSGKKSKPETKSVSVILIQCVEDPYYFILWATIINLLKRETRFSVHQLIPRGCNLGESSSVKHWVYTKLTRNKIFDQKWVHLYAAVCDKIAYRNMAFLDAFLHPFEFVAAWKKWGQLRSLEDVLTLNFDGIEVGDLIYDTYLRYKPSPTVKLQDLYLLLIIWRSIRFIRKANTYFKDVKPAFFFTSYTTYIQHGVPVRIALAYGVPVYSFGNLFELYKKITIQDLFHSKNTANYASIFSQLEDLPQKLADAEQALKKRFSGEIDLSTSYMRQSAYKTVEQNIPDLTGYTVIFLHDFFDSPHIYGWLLFPDFWIWICFTIDTLRAQEIPFAIKPHPNQAPEAKDALDTLKLRFPDVTFLSPNYTNVQLVNAGMVQAVTVYGTIAHEMAYFGISTIACGLNPHQSYTFCKTATSLESYRQLLVSARLSAVDKNQMRLEALSFYFMHNLYDDISNRIVLRSTLIKLKKCLEEKCNNPETTQEKLWQIMNELELLIKMDDKLKPFEELL